MIAIIDVSVQAANPSMPLFPWRAFINSPSSIRVRNVPKRIGKWSIEKVYVTAAYPDYSIKTAQCILNGGIWVGTIAGSTVSGMSKNGYTIFADGTDENGNAVTGYILGKGDIQILEADGTITPSENAYYVHMLSAEPNDPRDGDLWQISGSWFLYQDGEAWPIGDDSGLIGQISAELSTKADLSALDALANSLSSKQDKLSDAQISAIDSVVDERKTVITFSDNTTSSFNWVGEINRQMMADAGLVDEYGQWITHPTRVKIGNAVTSIGNSAFVLCETLTTVEIPKSVTSIGVASFFSCFALSDVVIPDSVTTIGQSAFDSCSNLSSIELPNGLATIGNSAFAGCSNLSSITIPKSVTSIEDAAFTYCQNLHTVIIEKASTTISSRAFSNCPSITSFTFLDCPASLISVLTNYPWGVDNLSVFKTWNDASQEWVKDQNYGQNFAYQAVAITPRNTLALQPYKINTNTLNSARASFKVSVGGTAGNVARELFFAFTIGNFTQPMTWDASIDKFEGGSAAAVAPKPNTTNVYHIVEYTNGHFSVSLFNGTYDALSAMLANKADVSALSGYVPYVTDVDGNKTAITVGSRATSNIGAGSMTVGMYNKAPSAGGFAVGAFAEANNGYTTAIGLYAMADGLAANAHGLYCKAKDTYSYVIGLKASTPYYESHGQGTFNVNPEGGLSGFYIGEQSLANTIDNKADLSTLSGYVELIPNSNNGKKTAVTVGSRKSGSAIGDGSFSIGARNVAVGTGSMTVGEDLSALGNNSVAVGVNCRAADTSFALGWNCQVSNDLAFAWNYDDFNDYSSHGLGTFNINPKNGLSGFYIGEQNLGQIIGDVETLISSL